MKFETAFYRAWGRAPTKAEIANVERVCDAFEVRDNDALKAIAGLLEYYHSHLRVYPGQCTTAVQQWLGSADGAAALRRALSATSSPSSQRRSAETETSHVRTVSDARWVPLAALATASSALSGALGMLAGSALSGRQPCWVPRGTVDRVIASVLGAPMGWVFLLPLLVPAYFGAVWGWRRGVSTTCSLSERWIGGATAAAIAVGVLVWVALTTRLVLHG